MKLIMSVALVVLVVGMAGCSEEISPESISTNGVVTLDGRWLGTGNQNQIQFTGRTMSVYAGSELCEQCSFVLSAMQSNVVVLHLSNDTDLSMTVSGDRMSLSGTLWYSGTYQRH